MQRPHIVFSPNQYKGIHWNDLEKCDFEKFITETGARRELSSKTGVVYSIQLGLRVPLVL